MTSEGLRPSKDTEADMRPTSCGPAETAPFSLCRICETEKPPRDEVVVQPCEHVVCKECLKDYLVVVIGERQTNISCPYFRCQSVLIDEVISAAVTPEAYRKLVRFREAAELERNPLLRWCPKADCDGYDVQTGEQRELKCRACGYSYCFDCSEAFHGDSPCPSPSDSLSPTLKFCPKCHVKVERSEGCSHMVCPRCRFEWCWLCGKPYFSMHFMTCDVMRSELRNPSNDSIVLFLLLPLIAILFLLVAAAMWLNEMLRMNGKVRAWLQGHRWICPVVIFFSFLFFPCILIFTLLFCGVGLMADVGEYLRANPRPLSVLARKERLWAGITTVLGLLISPIVVAVTVLIVAVGPVIGVVLWVIKCCNRHPRPVQVHNPVPGYRVGEV